MGKNKKQKKAPPPRETSTTSKEQQAKPKPASSLPSNSGLLPLAFPSHLPRPKDNFLRNQKPYKESFQTALKTSYEGFAVDESIGRPNESKIQQAMDELLQKHIFRTDVTQPFGLGTKCAKTYVTRCCVGQQGTTYKYLGLRMFAHPWSSFPTIASLKSTLAERSQHHLKHLDEIRSEREAPSTRGRADFDICLINRMEASKDLKLEPSIGKEKSCVSWHADSSLEHFSTIAVYQTILPNKKNESCVKDWSVALRVAHNSEGPASSRRGTDIESSIVTETPPIAVSLDSGSAYYLLDDFNHHHQHTVITSGSNQSAGVRYSLTYRLLRDTHNISYVMERCRSCVSNFHKKGTKLWRSEQLLLTEMESEWLRQFYIQGSQHHELLWSSWGDSIQRLLHSWSQLETRTRQTFDLLRAAAEGRCGLDKASSDEAPTRAERKERERRKKAHAAVEELIGRTGTTVDNVEETIYGPFAELLEERAQMRELWGKREKDHVFHDLSPDCRPISLPFMFGATGDQKPIGESGISPMPGSPEELRRIATSLRSLGKAYTSGRSSDLPKNLETQAQQQKGPSEDDSARRNDHAQPLNWPGWGQHSFCLELQAPWAGAVLDGSKSIETRAYDLPPGLLGKRILIIESPTGAAGVSNMGNVIDFKSSKAKVIGWCTFCSVKKYTNRKYFEADESAHLVSADSGYGWKDNKTNAIYGWVVGEYGQNKSKTLDSAVRRMRSLFQIQQTEVDSPKKRKGKRDNINSQDKKHKKRRY